MSCDQSVSDFSVDPSMSAGSQQLRGAPPPPPTPQTTPPADTLVGEKREAQRTVEVTVPGEVPLIQDLFLNYFENDRNGGGTVDDVTIDEDERLVYVVFKDPEVAKRVAEHPHSIVGQSIMVQMMTLNNLLKEKREAQRTVEVTVGETVPLTQDLFLHHFESARNGGGVVDDVTIDEDERVVHVVFKDAEVANRVVERTHEITEKPVTVRKMKFCKETAEAKKKAQRTVEVTVGETVPMTQDLFWNHFENTRNGGSAVDDVTIDENERVVHVVFKDAEVARNVSTKDHIIAGQPATVKMMVFRKSRTGGVEVAKRQQRILGATPTYPDMLLLKNVPDNLERNLLSHFVQRVTGLRPLDILYGETPGSVLVRLDGHVGFPSSHTMCQELDLAGNTVRVSKVPLSSCLVVTNVDPEIKEHLIKLYFESTDSQGGPVMSVERKGQEGKWFVHFKDYQVADRVLQQTHCLAGKDLRVKRHLPCLGEDGGSHEPNTFAMPEDLVLSGVEKHKLAFLRQARGKWDEFCRHLARVHAKPTVEGDVLIVTCSLTVEVPKVRVLAKTWHHDARAAAERYLGLLEVQKRNVIGEIWKEAGAAVEKANIANTQDAMVLTDPQDTTYIVVGIKTAVDALLKQVNCAIKELEDEVERKKQEITDRKKLKPGQAQLLAAIGFPSQAQEMSKNLQVKISPTEILFHGNLTDVQKAMIEMFDKLETFTTKSMAIGSVQKLDYLRHRQVQQYVSEKLRAQSPTIVWEVTDDTRVKVHGLEGDDLGNALAIIDGAVCECEIQLPPESLDLPKSREWKEMVHQLAEGKPGFLSVCSLKEDKVFIIGTDNVFEKARDEVNTYLSMNTIYTEVVLFSPSRQKFIVTFMIPRLQEIERTLWTHKVRINPIDSNEKIEVSGRKKGVDQAKSELQDVEKDIVCHEESVTDSAKIAFLKSESCLRDLGLVAREARCVFAFTRGTPGMQVESSSDTTPEVFQVKQTRRGVQTTLTVLYQGAALSTLEGDITQMTVDAIVNAANDRMEHSGGLAKDVVTKGGHKIQMECRRLLTERGKMTAGDVLISGPGRLPCKAVFHAVGPLYKDGESGERESLQLTVTNCLQSAVAKGYDSIAFPAISSGIFGYPPAQSTHVIVGAVKSFLEANNTSGIQEVFFCAFDKAMRQYFEAAFGKCFPELVKNTAPSVFSSVQVFSSTVGEVAANTVPRAGALFQEIVKIVEGQIAEQTTDVIVNSSSVDLKLKNGAVSKSLLTAAGPQLQEECKAKYPTNLLTGQIAVTSGYDLSCKEVYHIALPRWDGPGSKSFPQILHGYVTGCLDLASGQGYTSVAFPVLGTGNRGFPPDVVAQTMLRAMEEFQNNRPLSSLREIKVVVYHTDTDILQAFKAAAAKQRPTHNVTLRTAHRSVVAKEKRCGGVYSTCLAPKEPKLLIIYAENQSHIDDFKKQFQQLVDDKITQTEIPFETNSKDHSAQVATIKRIGLQHNVQTDVQPGNGCIVLHGFNNDVLVAFAAVSKFLKDNLVASMVQWYFIEVQSLGTERMNYDPSTNATIEAAYKKQEKTVEIKDKDGDVYVIDFHDMVEYKKNDPQSRVDVNRRIKIQESGTEPPTYWAPQKDDLNMVPLKRTTEYLAVEANFLSSAGNKKIVVTAIDRVQNRTLYSQYQTKKTQLEAQNPDIQNEMTLWHGTASDATDNINQYGFNRSYCGKNATYYGEGVYFAVKSSYSVRNKYSPPDRSGLCRIYQCKVLVGHSVVGHEKMRILPRRQGSRSFYDSAKNSDTQTSMYVIFNDTQAYPEYLVTFKYQ